MNSKEKYEMSVERKAVNLVNNCPFLNSLFFLFLFSSSPSYLAHPSLCVPCIFLLFIQLYMASYNRVIWLKEVLEYSRSENQTL